MMTKTDPRDPIDLKGRLFMPYAGVLDLATQAGIKSLEAEVVQLPSKDNGGQAICRAVLEMADGRRFVDFGEASPATLKQHLIPHALLMSATRAKGRVLRDAVNVGEALAEEMADHDARPAGQFQSAPPQRARPQSPPSTVQTRAGVEDRLTGEIKEPLVTPLTLEQRFFDTFQRATAIDALREDEVMHQFRDLNVKAATDEMLESAIQELESLIGIYSETDGPEQKPQGAAPEAQGGPYCQECGLNLTPGQIAVSRASCKGAILCPRHQKGRRTVGYGV